MVVLSLILEFALSSLKRLHTDSVLSLNSINSGKKMLEFTSCKREHVEGND